MLLTCVCVCVLGSERVRDEMRQRDKHREVWRLSWSTVTGNELKFIFSQLFKKVEEFKLCFGIKGRKYTRRTGRGERQWTDKMWSSPVGRITATVELPVQSSSSWGQLTAHRQRGRPDQSRSSTWRSEEVWWWEDEEEVLFFPPRKRDER